MDISIFHVTGESKRKSGNFIPDIRNRNASEIKQKLVEAETHGKWGETGMETVNYKTKEWLVYETHCKILSTLL